VADTGPQFFIELTIWYLSTNEDFFPRSRRTIKITAGIFLILRGLFFDPDIYPPQEDLSAFGGMRSGRKGHFGADTN
jgi:hypothetical protein